MTSFSLTALWICFNPADLCSCRLVCLQTERLQYLLADNEKVNLSDIEPIPLPLEPQIRIKGIVPETATLFKVGKKSFPSRKST